ncbi:MAG: hypothetical protein HWE39_17145 [Oceanospirillaceae bacterium]|nr:hypothetical protein [Oceanospirillaceae bacterium]
MSIDALINKGCLQLNKEKPLPAERTVIVVGSARGGTSIAAGALFHLGVPMFSAGPPVFEDIHLSNAFEKADKKRYRSIIERFNAESVWAWKRPSNINYLAKVVKEVRNPIFVVMVRDAFAIGVRNSISMKSNAVKSMTEALMHQQKVMRFFNKNTHPILFCSVEKVKQYPDHFINSLVSFCELQPSQEQIEDAIHFIEPEPSEYLEASRINRSHGQIGGVRNGCIFGWAAWVYRDEPVTVELIKNGKVIDSTEATEWRDHGEGIKNKRNGYCGYRFNLALVNVEVGDTLHVKVKSDVRDLKNSPVTIKQEDLLNPKVQA